jgi:hypothetical protein
VDIERRQHERARTKTLLEKTPHNGEIMFPGDEGQTPRSGQGVVKGMDEHVERALLPRGNGEHPGVTQLIEESPQGDTVVPGGSALRLSVLEKLANTRLVKRFSSQVLILEPVAQVRDQPQFLLGGEVRVPLLRESPGKPVDIRFQGASLTRLRGQGISTSRNGHRSLLLKGVVESVRRRQPNYAE